MRMIVSTTSLPDPPPEVGCPGLGDGGVMPGCGRWPDSATVDAVAAGGSPEPTRAAVGCAVCCGEPGRAAAAVSPEGGAIEPAVTAVVCTESRAVAPRGAAVALVPWAESADAAAL